MLKKEEHLNFYRGRDNAYHDGVTFFDDLSRSKVAFFLPRYLNKL